jgi:hypothetical protein
MIYTGITEVLREKVAQLPFVHNKFHSGRPGAEPEAQLWKTLCDINNNNPSIRPHTLNDCGKVGQRCIRTNLKALVSTLVLISE